MLHSDFAIEYGNLHRHRWFTAGRSSSETKASVISPEKLFTPDQLTAMKQILPQLQEASGSGLTRTERGFLRTTGTEKINKAASAAGRNIRTRIGRSGVRGGINRGAFKDIEEARIGSVGELESGIGKLGIERKGANLDRLLRFITKPRAQVAGGKTTGSSFGLNLFGG